MKTPTYLFLDLETTGLEPMSNYILELHSIVADQNFDPITTHSSVFKWDELAERAISPWALDIHTKSGLIDECKKSDVTLHVYESQIVSELTSLYGEKLNLILAGNSIHFDKSFLKVHTSALMKLLHYRNFDVSTVLQLFGHTDKLPRPKDIAHRAKADILCSLELAQKAYRLVA